MAITRKPRRSPAPAVDIEALIKRGGSPTGDEGDSAKPSPILLRVPSDMLQRIDASLKTRPIKVPRHTWILEAIHEKLSRELQNKM